MNSKIRYTRPAHHASCFGGTAMNQENTTANSVLKTLQEIKGLNETSHAFERTIADFVTANTFSEIEPILDKFTINDDPHIGFIAFCALCEGHRRVKNYKKQEEILKNLHKQHDPQNHPFITHLELLYYIDNFDYRHYDDYITILQKAQSHANSEDFTQNAGAHHLFADLVAIVFEYAFSHNRPAPSNTWLQYGIDAVNRAISKSNGYAKYYCTKARLLAFEKKYEDSAMLIKEAINLEDSSKKDYTIRVNEYLNHLQMIRVKQSQDQVEKLDSLVNEIQQELQRSTVKSIEFVGLFAGIVSFTIGSISLLGDSTFADAAGLIIILMGALLCVFSGFGVILHGFARKKWIRNLLVFFMGLGVILLGFYFGGCFPLN